MLGARVTKCVVLSVRSQRVRRIDRRQGAGLGEPHSGIDSGTSFDSEAVAIGFSRSFLGKELETTKI